jgi:hypothetical protein
MHLPDQDLTGPGGCEAVLSRAFAGFEPRDMEGGVPRPWRDGVVVADHEHAMVGVSAEAGALTARCLDIC